MSTAYVAIYLVAVLTPLMLLHLGHSPAGGRCRRSLGRSVAQPVGRATITGTAVRVPCGLVVCDVGQGTNRHTEGRADGADGRLALLEERSCPFLWVCDSGLSPSW